MDEKLTEIIAAGLVKLIEDLRSSEVELISANNDVDLGERENFSSGVREKKPTGIVTLTLKMRCIKEADEYAAWKKEFQA